jgi:hypothetical protein
MLISASYLGDLMQYEMRSGELTIWGRGVPRDDLTPGASVFWSVAQSACFLVSA